MSKRLLVLAMLALFSMFVMAGCSGDDGKDGQGLTQEELDRIKDELREEFAQGSVSASSSETCGVCHGEGKDLSPAAHVEYVSTARVVVSSELEAEVVGSNIEVRFSLADRSGAPFTGYTGYNTLYYLWTDTTDPANPVVVRAQMGNANLNNGIAGGTVLSQPTPGDYLMTIPAVHPGSNADLVANVARLAAKLADPATADIRLLLTLTDGNAGQTSDYYNYYVNLQKDYGTPPRDLFTGAACASCHGGQIFDRGHNTALTADGLMNKSTYGYHYGLDANNGENCTVCHSYGSKGLQNKLFQYAHRIHSTDPQNVEAVKSGKFYGISYPNDMANCAVCHDTDAARGNGTTDFGIVDNKYFTYELCMSCHATFDDVVAATASGATAADIAAVWDGWTKTQAGGTASFHRAFAPGETCSGCHAATGLTFKDFHAGWNPVVSGANGANRYEYKVDSVTFAENANGSITGTAVISVEKNGTPVTLNTALTAATEAAPRVAPSVYFTTGYGKNLADGGFDWINEGSANAYASTTTVVYNGTSATATFTITKEAVDAGVNVIGVLVGGRPQYTANGATVNIPVNSRIQAVALDVAAPAMLERRATTEDAKCIACHGGTLELHGGSRVIAPALSKATDDAGVQGCVACHNSSAVDKLGRNYHGITAANAADGKDQESFDFKVLVHRIHGASEGELYAVYRERGTYAFRSQFTDAPTGIGNDNVVTYPRAIKDCSACHKAGAFELVDQSQALPFTVIANELDTRLDDVIIGPNQAACGTCHNAAGDTAHMTSLGYKGKGNKVEVLKNK